MNEELFMNKELKYEKIWEKILEPNEEIKYEFSTSEKYYKFLLLLFGGLLIAIIILSLKSGFFEEVVSSFKESEFKYVYIIGAIIFLSGIFALLGRIYEKQGAWALTNKRVLLYYKIKRYNTDLLTFQYNEIIETFIEEHFLGVFFNTGNLVIRTTKPFIYEKEEDEYIHGGTYSRITRIREKKSFISD